MSPVETWGQFKCWRNNFACVPFPDPGGPNKIKQNRFMQWSVISGQWSVKNTSRAGADHWPPTTDHFSTRNFSAREFSPLAA
jgi:hypothetical protein